MLGLRRDEYPFLSPPSRRTGPQGPYTSPSLASLACTAVHSLLWRLAPAIRYRSEPAYPMAERLPPDVRKIVADTLDEEFEQAIEADIAKVDKAAAARLPPPPLVLGRERPR